MASYDELRSLFGSGELQNKVEVALCVKAAAIVAEATPSAERLAWAETALIQTTTEATKTTKYLLAANQNLALGAIETASDSAIQTKVDVLVDKLHP